MKRLAPEVQPVGLDVAQAAQLIGCGQTTFHRLRREPGFPAAREVASGVNRWISDELIEWLKARPAVTPKPEPERLRTRRYRAGQLVEGRKPDRRGAE